MFPLFLFFGRKKQSLIKRFFFAFVQVMTIGMIELFLVPCWVGVCLDALSLPLFDSDGDARLAWTEVNPISSMALHW